MRFSFGGSDSWEHPQETHLFHPDATTPRDAVGRHKLLFHLPHVFVNDRLLRQARQNHVRAAKRAAGMSNVQSTQALDDVGLAGKQVARPADGRPRVAEEGAVLEVSGQTATNQAPAS